MRYPTVSAFFASLFACEAIALPSQTDLPTEIRLLVHARSADEIESDPGKPAGYPGLRFRAPALADLGRRFACKSVARLTPWDHSEGTLILRFPRTWAARTLIEAYRASGRFDAIEEDGIGFGHGAPVPAVAMAAAKAADATVDPNDPYFGWQYGLKNTGTRTFESTKGKSGADIKAVEAWAIQPGSEAILVAVLDCGLNLNHPDIGSRVWTNPKEIAGNGKDDDGNGYVDDVHGWSFANDPQIESQPGTADVSDGFGHGTNVAGIIGAIGDNGMGVSGVARCTIMPVKVLNAHNWGYYSWWAAGLRYAVDQGARIVNMSMGGPDGNTAALKSAVTYALQHGVTITVSMGNERVSTPMYPAAFDGIIAVGATGPDDDWVHSFPWDTTKGSNSGPHISVSAPGNFIYGLDYASTTNYQGYWSGTSQAAPHVAGVCALLLAQDPTRTPADLKRLIEAGADDQVGNANLDKPGFDAYFGHGRLNAKRSLAAGVTSILKPLPHADGGWGRLPSGIDFLGRLLPAASFRRGARGMIGP